MALADAVDGLVTRVLARDTRAIARAMRLIDERAPAAGLLLKALHPHGGHAQVIGVTGTPGAGKSTIVDRVVARFRVRGLRVGVVAVDPTSPYTGGAILGDRIRMQRHFLDPDVFIRSLATRGHLGGLSRSAADVIRVLDAAHFDVVVVETVGVGQDELEVARLADTTIVVTTPGMGDDIQAIKAGILEVADVFAVNKADRDGADVTVRDLEQMIALGHHTGTPAMGRGHSAAAMAMPGAPDHEWSVPVLKLVATRDEGLDALIDACDRHRTFLGSTETGARRLAQRREDEFRAILLDTLLLALERHAGDDVRGALERVQLGEVDPYTAADELVAGVIRGVP